MTFGVGESSKGIFGGTASGGRAFRHHRGKKMGALDRFAEELSKHSIAAGDPGGDVRRSAERLGYGYPQGNAMLQRIRKKLGWQAV